jgi:hypothetical protein
MLAISSEISGQNWGTRVLSALSACCLNIASGSWRRASTPTAEECCCIMKDEVGSSNGVQVKNNGFASGDASLCSALLITRNTIT